MSQTVSETIVTLEYDRPVARGRELFGELIEWDMHHAIFPFEAVIFRTGVTPQTSSHLEVLDFYFPEVGPYEATLSLHDIAHGADR